MARVSVQVPIEQSETAAESQNSEPINDANIQSDSNQAPSPIPAEPPAYTQRPVLMAGRRLTLAGFVILVIVIFAFMAVLNDRNHLKQQVKQAATQASTPANDAQKYQEEIGKIVELPTGQTPSLIPVKDAKSLAADNQFFKNAQNGDVVLLYVSPDKSVRAILYRPSTHKVVEATSNATIGTGTTPSSTKQ